MLQRTHRHGRTGWLLGYLFITLMASPLAAQEPGAQPAAPWLREVPVLHNEAWRVAALLAAMLIALAVGRLVRLLLETIADRLAGKQRPLASVACRALARSTNLVALALGLDIGLRFIHPHPDAAPVLAATVGLVWISAVARVGYALVSVVDAWLRQIAEGTSSKLDDMLVPLVRKSLKGTVIVLALVQAITLLSDRPAASILAGLGVGGLAVGLAAQDTIKNLFGSMMIFGDRPFELGDEITVDALTGVVETVGFRSTRFRTGDGHLVTIPNGELANKTIVNVAKRQFFSRRLNLALPYDLGPERVAQALEIVRALLADHEGSRPHLPARVHLSDITPTALNLLVQYWYFPAAYWDFVAFNERLNLEILRRFRAAEIPLAYPTQSLRLAGQLETREAAPSEQPPEDT